MRFNMVIAALFGALMSHNYAQAVEPYEYANPSSMTTKALILDVAENRRPTGRCRRIWSHYIFR